jgi:hypothetical protein
MIVLIFRIESYIRHMKHYILAGLVLVFLLSACGRKAEKAAEYNNTLILRQMRVIEALDVMDSTLRDSTVSEERMDYAFANLQARVKSAVMAVDSIGSFNQDPSLQIAARELFRSYEAMTDGDYARLVAIRKLPDSVITEAVVDTNNAIIARIQDMSAKAQQKFILAQDEFGKKYHLTFD